MNKQLKTRASKVSEGSVDAPPGRRERAKRDKLRRITEAARHLFETQGFEKTTTQQIADVADIGTGTLFLYTESKEDLLIMVFEGEMREQAAHAFSRISESASPVDQICSVFSDMMDYHAKDLMISEVLIKSMVMAPAAEHRSKIHGELMATIFDGLEGIAMGAKKDGIFPKRLDAGVAARTMFSCYYLGLVRWLTGQNTREDFEARLRNQCEQTIDPNGKANKKRARALG
ncbi:MAG: TetR/AcrR family transcriptional regulator [Halieaceae bacterium]|nr:TetR/AcrR family transcriptional regulator [Halieaceae bacterium]